MPICMHSNSIINSPIFNMTVMMFSDIVESVILLIDDA